MSIKFQFNWLWLIEHHASEHDRNRNSCMIETIVVHNTTPMSLLHDRNWN